MFSIFNRSSPPKISKASSENHSLSQRVEIAKFVMQNSVNDFFGGWESDDIELLASFRPKALPAPKNGEIIDWLGIKTNSKYHAWLNVSENNFFVNQELPVPDDMVHAETIEYVALITAINKAINFNRKTFTAVELGASYAPWVIAAGVLAQRSGFKRINLIAVEASESMAPEIIKHAEMNNLLNNDSINLKSIQGAIAGQDGIVFFPKVNVAGDNGAQIALADRGRDYRGLDLEHQEVQAFSLETLLKDSSRIDFLHMDVQGAELELLNNVNFLSTLDQKVALFFLATQSRLIEGVALERLGSLGWSLIRERPTIFKQNDRTKDVNGWTLRDGGQIWINNKLFLD